VGRSCSGGGNVGICGSGLGNVGRWKPGLGRLGMGWAMAGMVVRTAREQRPMWIWGLNTIGSLGDSNRLNWDRVGDNWQPSMLMQRVT
jgi:hypothetical protein